MRFKTKQNKTTDTRKVERGSAMEHDQSSNENQKIVGNAHLTYS